MRKVIIILSCIVIGFCMYIYIFDCFHVGTEFVCDMCIAALRSMCSDFGITYAQINIALFIILEPFLILINIIIALLKNRSLALSLLTIESIISALVVSLITIYYIMEQIKLGLEYNYA